MTKIIDKIVKSKYPPKQTNVTWIDTSQKPAVTKSYIDGTWVVVGGGGGTKKYSDLEEKPLINGVELDGNKTSSDLGVATSQQGTKADTAYQKPSSGIPQFDLSSDVQSQLNKHFKGWYDTLEELKAAHTATEGDSANVKDDGATTWSIYVFDATATTDNNWADSGTDADTSNVQTFESGEEVNETPIDNTHLVNPADGALPKAEDVMQLKAKLEGVTAEEVKPIATNESTTMLISGDNGSEISPSSIAAGWKEFEISGYKRVRFLGMLFKNPAGTNNNFKAGYCFGHYDGTTWVVDSSARFDTKSTESSSNAIKEYQIDVPTTSTHIRITSTWGSWLTKFYCYLQSGESVVDLISDLQSQFDYIGKVDLSILLPTGGVSGSNRYTLETALNVVPESYQKGGLIIKFIDSVTTNYVEYRLVKSTWSTNVNDWEDVSDKLVRGNHIASTDSVIDTLYGKEDEVIELSYDVTSGVATNVYKNVILKANNTYMIVYADYPNGYTMYNAVLVYNGSTIVPCYIDKGSTASSSVISMNDSNRIVRLIRPTIDSTRIRFQQAADKNTVSGTVKFRIIKLSDEKGLANIKDTVDNTSALILKQNIKNTRPYYFGEGYVGLESYINPSYLEERIKAVPEGKHFIFNTDSHIDYGRTVDQDNIGYGNLQKETEIMKYVKDRLGIRNVVFGGDCIGGADSKYEAVQILSIYCDDKFNAFGSDFLYCQGNHDANYAQWSNHEAPVPPETDLIISDTEIYKRTTRYMKQYGKAVFDDLMLEGADKIDFSQYVNATTGVDNFGYTAEQLKEEFKAWAMLHYYYDDDVQKIRYIVLETGDFSHAYRKLVGTGAHTGMDLLNDFIARSLLTVPKDYDVVIVGHQIVYETNDEVDYTTNRGLNAWIHTQMILNAYINKSYVTYRSRDTSALDFAKEMYPKLIYGDFGTNQDFGQYRKYDFSHVVGSGRIFICGGHYHANDCYMVHFSGSGSSQRVAYTEYDGSTFPESQYVLDIKFDRCVANGRSSGWVGSGSHPYATSYPNDVSSNTEPMEQRLGTVKEVLFDVVTITPDNRVVCTRFGAGGTGDSGIENQGNREFRLFAPEQSND